MVDCVYWLLVVKQQYLPMLAVYANCQHSLYHLVFR